MPRYANFVNRLPTYPFAKVGRLSREVQERDGITVINARIGIPDMEAPPTVKARMAEYVAEKNSTFGYPVDMHPERGIPELVDAIRQHYREKYGVDLQPENIMVTGWSKEFLHNLPRLFHGNGVIPDPVYPAYVGATITAGNDVRYIPTSAGNDWIPDMKFQDSDAYFFLCDPNNPTGSVATLEYYERLHDEMKRADVFGIFDKAYKDYVFDNSVKPVSIVQIPEIMERGYELVSLSKHHNFVGIGLGWVVSTPENIRRLNEFYGHIWQGVPWYHQKAGVVALTDPNAKAEMEQYMQELKGRRQVFVDGLNDLGLKCEALPATPYIWLEVPKGRDDEEFVLGTILDKGHVAFMPGSYFGQSGRGYARATVFLPEEAIQEALTRISAIRDW